MRCPDSFRNPHPLQAVIENPKDAHALFGWALVLTHLYRQYEEAEKFFIRALDAAPSDHRIVEGYNYLLLECMNADYDAFEAFQSLQQERGLVAVVEESHATMEREMVRLFKHVSPSTMRA